MNGKVIRRAALIALALGTLLTLGNQSGAVFGSRSLEFLPLVLVYLTPFLVVAVSQLLGAARAAVEPRGGTSRVAARESLLSTALSHGIPLRATLVGLLMGGINTAIVATALLLESGSPGPLPLPLLAQAFSLPILFGLLSQAAAYRGAAAALDRASGVGRIGTAPANE
jgi:hypothetical protein